MTNVERTRLLTFQNKTLRPTNTTLTVNEVTVTQYLIYQLVVPKPKQRPQNTTITMTRSPATFLCLALLLMNQVSAFSAVRTASTSVSSPSSLGASSSSCKHDDGSRRSFLTSSVAAVFTATTVVPVMNSWADDDTGDLSMPTEEEQKKADDVSSFTLNYLHMDGFDSCPIRLQTPFISTLQRRGENLLL